MVEPKLAIVIPAFCEERTIREIVAASSSYGSVLVIDDCSHDCTRAEAITAGAIVITNDANLGYDMSLTRGVQEAGKRGFTHVITMDADGEHDPVALLAFRTKLIDENHALVLGYRSKKPRIAESLMGYYFYLRFGVRDILCGMKGYRLSDYVECGSLSFQASIGTELARCALRRGLLFAQVPVGGTPRMDRPRFDTLLRANFRVLVALLRTIKRDVGWK